MSTNPFAIQKLDIFGSYGEFSVGNGPERIRAEYLLTKIKPGQKGLWENQLANQMAPWREVFKLEELSFEELIQRDLDDSRVAHDLIPYLLGETGHHAKFFPPILAVLAPRKEGASGIASQYPAPDESNGDHRVTFGDLFEFQKLSIEGHVSPLGVIRYNPQKTAMVIVDGQHRAMAVLALHRQLNKNLWGNNPFGPYYSHIHVKPEDVEHVELPVCIMYFPDINPNHPEFKEKGIDLTSICREIFTVVNKQAKEVSKSRELLLDDEDFAAFMMRQTLSNLKDRSGSDKPIARIYSFAYGDAEADNRSQVMSGKHEFCSAVAIHKLHLATSFGYPDCYRNLANSSDVTDGRYVRNPSRPYDLLTGTKNAPNQPIGRKTAKSYNPDQVVSIVNKLGTLTDSIIMPLFDQLRPFSVINEALRQKLEELSSTTAMADPIQSKCRALLFEGAGARHTFEEHTDRIKSRKIDLEERGESVPQSLLDQIAYCNAVNSALTTYEDGIRLSRAFSFFNIDQNQFNSRDSQTVESELKEIRHRARTIFDTISTQAFQIGYLMAVNSAVEYTAGESPDYNQRLKCSKFISALYIASLNEFFNAGETKHRSLTGYVTEPRSKCFDTKEPGFRKLLSLCGVSELNEKQWEFFRYLVLEIVHSKFVSKSFNTVFDNPTFSDERLCYLAGADKLLTEIEQVRKKYIGAAVRHRLNSQEFNNECTLLRERSKNSNVSEHDIESLVTKLRESTVAEVESTAKNYIKASLGRIEDRTKTLERLNGLASE